MQFARAIALWAELPVVYILCYLLSFRDISDYDTLFIPIYTYIYIHIYAILPVSKGNR